MNRKKITVVCPSFSEENKKRMAEAAGSYGYDIMFYDGDEAAEQDASESEIVVGSSLGLLRAAPQAKWYCGTFAGVDSIIDSVPERMILTNASGAYGVTISEYIVMILLELLRRRPEYNRIVEEKKWIRNLPIRSLCGSSVLILGTGDIGKYTAMRLRGFDPAKIIGVNRSGRNPEELFDEIVSGDRLESILPEADIVILCMPDTAETRNMLSEKRIGMLKQGAYIVNVGRGSAIDQKALIKALNEGRIAGAGLDVFETEPVPQDDPVWNTKNLIMTPHISGNMSLGYTVERIVDLFCDNLENYCLGKQMTNVVDTKRGY